MRAWALALFVAPLLTGCIGDDVETTGAASVRPQDALHSVAEILPFEALADDGVALRGHVYVPDGEGPFATVLNFSPYWNFAVATSDTQARDEDGRTALAGSLGKYLDAGFAVALVNLRGTGISAGCPTWFDFEVDGADAYAVIETIAAESWSNGNVGMAGISWHGYSQYAALAHHPPALKAVIPSSAILDLWTLWTRHGPTIVSQFGPMATTYAVFTTITSTGVVGTPPEHAACPSYAEQIAAFNQLTLDGDKSPFLEHRQAYDILASSDVPIFVTNGLTHLGEGHILQIDGLWPLLNPERRLLIGQWPHAYPDGEKADEFDEEAVAWFDHYLRGGPKTIGTGVVEYEDDAGEWHESPVWPPRGDVATLFLSDGALVADAGAVAASRATFASHAVSPMLGDCPGTQALYVSEPLAEDVLLAGNFFANVTVESTLPNGNFAVFLYHAPEVGACPLPHEQVDLELTPNDASRALSDLRHRGLLEQGSDFPVGSPDVMQMRSHAFASRVPAGDRLIVAIGGGSAELAARAEHPVLTVVTGPGIAGDITLSVVEGTLRSDGGAAPTVSPSPLALSRT